MIFRSKVVFPLSNVRLSLFATWETLSSGRLKLVPREGHSGEFIELAGSPDWVLEVVSRNSVRKDTKLLRQSYHRAGIPEYWLVDAMGEEIDFQLLIHEPDAYVQAESEEGWRHSPVFNRSLRLERRRDRLGYWDYTLHVRP
jgi:Uma2 family endonuclease